MMQPVDIKSQSFKKGLFGYKKTDIDQYVDTVYRAYDELFTENKKLREENDRLNKVLEEDRLKLFNLENGRETGSGASNTDAETEKRRAEIIANAEKAAQDIIQKAREESARISGDTDEVKVETKSGTVKTEPVSDKEQGKPQPEKKAESATSKFFKKADDTSSAADTSDDDVFVGEIEDNRKPGKVMIGDGEEEGADDFEFL